GRHTRFSRRRRLALRAARVDPARGRDARDVAEAPLAGRGARRVRRRARGRRREVNEIPYEGLTPDVMLAAVESVGFVPNGRMLALNSYENRVYQIGTEDGFVVVKFYRPGRWS